MNRGVLQNSPVKQMMRAGSINCLNSPQHPSPFISSSYCPLLHHYPTPASSLPLGSLRENQQLPEPWSQLLINEPTWGQVLQAASFPTPIEGFTCKMLDFSGSNVEGTNSYPDHLSECNSSTVDGPAFKKARIQSSAQSTFKVRKEKLGDRITVLHQLACPFGKTDTASVLLEAIGYIRFLQGQIEALSSPYSGSGPENMRQSEDSQEAKDLRSRGLCLVPVSCTMNVGSTNGADYWSPTPGGEL